MTLTAIEPTWIGHGACRGLDPVLFHPERGESTREAKAVCAECSVRVECLSWALTTYQVHGIYGGTSERERRRIRQRLADGQPVPQLDPTPDPTPPPDGHPPAVPLPTKEPAVDLVVNTTEPAASEAPANGAGPADPKPGLATDACVNCGKRYTPDRKTQRFHSKECARAWYATHPKGETGERQPRIRTARKTTAQPPDPPDPPAPAADPPPLPVPAPGPGPIESLLGQLLAGCDHWHVEADLGDVHVTVSRGRG